MEARYDLAWRPDVTCKSCWDNSPCAVHYEQAVKNGYVPQYKDYRPVRPQNYDVVGRELMADDVWYEEHKR